MEQKQEYTTEAVAWIDALLNNHEQTLVESILALKQHWFIKQIQQQREKMPEEEKIELYKKWSYSVWSTIKRSTWLSLPTRNLFSFLPTKDTVRKEIFHAFTPAIRLFVHLGIFSRPWWVDDETIKENIQTDAKGIKQQLNLLESACTMIPQLRPWLPAIEKIKPLLSIGADAQERILHAVNHAQQNISLTAANKETLCVTLQQTPYSDEIRMVA